LNRKFKIPFLKIKFNEHKSEIPPKVWNLPKGKGQDTVKF
jgi:hypothetical protein